MSDSKTSTNKLLFKDSNKSNKANLKTCYATSTISTNLTTTMTLVIRL